MKTIDLLVQALPAIGGWPEKVTHIGQDYDRELMFYGRGNVRSGIFLDQLAADHRKHGEKGTKITREQYEAALAAKNEGWIEWPGGECPVPRGTLVDVKYLCGDVNRHIKAGEPDSSGSIDTAFAVRWSKLGAEYDIIAYRLHKPQEATKANEEADLSECIGQHAAPQWGGEGVPPVGCECERSWCGDNWLACTVIFVSAETVVVKLANREAAYGVSEVKFRPIRSEADKKREEAIMSLAKAGGAAPFKYGEKLSDGQLLGSMWCELYDAIAAGEVRGVKLED